MIYGNGVERFVEQAVSKHCHCCHGAQAEKLIGLVSPYLDDEGLITAVKRT